jgi:type IV pilus assembly protein PilM
MSRIRRLFARTADADKVRKSTKVVPHTVGLDISATAVRAVEVAGEDKGFVKISKVAVIPLQPGAVQAGRIVDVNVVATAIAEAFESVGLSKTRVIAGIASPDSAVGSRPLPVELDPREREAAIRNDSTPISPRLRNDDSDISTYVAARNETGEGSVHDDVIAAAALKDQVDTIDRVCRIAGIDLHAIDLVGAALLRALVYSPEDDTCHAVVDVGATKTLVAVRRGLHLRSLRTVEYAGADVTRAIASAIQRDFAAAERQKRALRPVVSVTRSKLRTGYGEADEAAVIEAVNENTATEAYTVALDSLVEQIALGVDGARRAGDDPVAITLVGLSALLNGLPERLVQRLSIPASIGKPWAELAETSANAVHLENPERLPSLLLSLTAAIGLATWEGN